MARKKKKTTYPRAAAQMLGGVPRRKIIRVKRNEPCPCGSGKKYKECHASEGEEYLLKLTEQRERERRKEELEKSGVPWYKRFLGLGI